MATGHVSEFPVGSLVRIRERDWVVLPSDDTDIVCLRPLSGGESEICGIHRAIEGSRLQHADVPDYDERFSVLLTYGRLIADDVGVGKTIEAALIARELLDRGDAQGLCVLCPPHLATNGRKS